MTISSAQMGLLILLVVHAAVALNIRSPYINVATSLDQISRQASYAEIDFYDDDMVQGKGKKGGKKTKDAMHSKKGKKGGKSSKKGQGKKSGNGGSIVAPVPAYNPPIFAPVQIPSLRPNEKPANDPTLAPTQSAEPSITLQPTSSPTTTAAYPQKPIFNPNPIPGSNDNASHNPSRAPASEDSNSRAPDPSPRPTATLPNVTTSPEPGPTFSPTSDFTEAPSGKEGRRDLSPYGIAYTVTKPEVPGAIDYAEVALLTNNYLETYFKDLFAATNLTNLENFFTVFVRGNFYFNEPIQVDYESTAYFSINGSAAIPTMEDLDILLRQAFEGDNLDEYLGELSTLTSNVFSSTSNAQVVNSTSKGLSEVEQQQKQNAIAGSSQSDGSTTSGVATPLGISAGVLAVCSLLVLFAKRRRGRAIEPTITRSWASRPPASCTTNEDGTAEDFSWAETLLTETHQQPSSSELKPCLTNDDHYGAEILHLDGRRETSPLFGSPLDPYMEGGPDFRDVPL